MKIYKVRFDIKGMCGTESGYKFFVKEENAKKFVEEKDEAWTNKNGIVFHTAEINEVIETEDEKEAE